VRLAGAEISLFAGRPQQALDRLAGGAEGETCWPLKLMAAEAHVALGDDEAAWNEVRDLVPNGERRDAALARRAEIADLHQAGLERRIRESLDQQQPDAAIALAEELDREHPLDVEGPLLLAEAELAAGDVDATTATLADGRSRFGADAVYLRGLIEIARSAKLWAVALDGARDLVRLDPTAAPLRDEIERRWALANAPQVVQDAYASPLLTRAQLAVLLWWVVPETRNIDAGPPPIAADVVGRPDKERVVHALSLGLWMVDPVTHRAEPDRPLTVSSTRRMLRRLADLVGTAVPENAWLDGNPGDALDGAAGAEALAAFRRDMLSQLR